MANIKLYSTGCPKCNILASKLNAKGISFVDSDNIDHHM